MNAQPYNQENEGQAMQWTKPDLHVISINASTFGTGGKGSDTLSKANDSASTS